MSASSSTISYPAFSSQVSDPVLGEAIEVARLLVQVPHVWQFEDEVGPWSKDSIPLAERILWLLEVLQDRRRKSAIKATVVNRDCVRGGDNIYATGAMRRGFVVDSNVGYDRRGHEARIRLRAAADVDDPTTHVRTTGPGHLAIQDLRDQSVADLASHLDPVARGELAVQA